MPLGIEVGLSSGDFVLDGDPTSPPLKGHSPHKFRPMSVVAKRLDGLDGTWYGVGDCVRWGTSYPQNRGHTHDHPVFGRLLWPNGWMDEDATWYGSRSGPRPHCIRRAQLCTKRAQQPPIFSARVYCSHSRPSQLLLSSLLLPSGWMHQHATWYGGRPQPR